MSEKSTKKTNHKLMKKPKQKKKITPQQRKERRKKFFNPNTIQNKMRRSQYIQKLKHEKKVQQTKERRKRRQLEKTLGDKAPPKQLPQTIDSTREFDETIVDPRDEEIILDNQSDEISSYFVEGKTPKVFITSSKKPTTNIYPFLFDIKKAIPNSKVYYRRRYHIKEIVKYATNADFTDIIIINEDRKKPNAMLLIHLPNGPTAHFKISNAVRRKEMKDKGRPVDSNPEVILNRFTTRLGHTIARMLASLFPHQPDFEKRQVVTFHNQRDFIFFRFHRYIFDSPTQVRLQELGPQFTLKLRSLQLGTFDYFHGEYIYYHKSLLDTSRRRFFL